MKTTIQDAQGKVIGQKIDEGNGNATYLDRTGAVVARVKNGTTYTASGQVVGKGDQGMRCLR